jgi:hypothetical protein
MYSYTFCIGGGASNMYSYTFCIVSESWGTPDEQRLLKFNNAWHNHIQKISYSLFEWNNAMKI